MALANVQEQCHLKRLKRDGGTIKFAVHVGGQSLRTCMTRRLIRLLKRRPMRFEAKAQPRRGTVRRGRTG